MNLYGLTISVAAIGIGVSLFMLFHKRVAFWLGRTSNDINHAQKDVHDSFNQGEREQ